MRADPAAHGPPDLHCVDRITLALAGHSWPSRPRCLGFRRARPRRRAGSLVVIDGKMALRKAASMLEAEKRFRKIIGYRYPRQSLLSPRNLAENPGDRDILDDPRHVGHERRRRWMCRSGWSPLRRRQDAVAPRGLE